MKLYHVRNICEAYENCPFVFANSVGEAFDKASKDREVGEYLTELDLEEGTIFIAELDLSEKKVTHWYWENSEWAIEATNPIE